VWGGVVGLVLVGVGARGGAALWVIRLLFCWWVSWGG